MPSKVSRIFNSSSPYSCPKLPPLSWWRWRQRSAGHLDATAKLLNLCAYLLNKFRRLRDNIQTANFLKSISREREMAVKVANRPDIMTAKTAKCSLLLESRRGNLPPQA
jgi:hypothetical protein